MRVVLCGVDTLHLHVTRELEPKRLDDIERLKAQAQRLKRGSPDLPRYRVGGQTFKVLPGGGQRGPLILDNEHMAISIAPSNPEGMHTAYAEVRSLYLWQRGFHHAGAEAGLVLSELTSNGPAAVSRIDLAADFQGWVPQEEDRKLFVCRARWERQTRTHKELTGWEWGKGAVHARIYDKTLEIAEQSGKEWFADLWREHQGYSPDDPVMRLEFQLKREALREFLDTGTGEVPFDVWDSAQLHCGNGWKALTGGERPWLSMRMHRTSDNRHLMDPRWVVLQKQPVVPGAGLVVPTTSEVDLLRVRRMGELDRTLGQLAGYLARGLAEREALGMTLPNWKAEVRALVNEAFKHSANNGRPILRRAAQLAAEFREAQEGLTWMH